MKRIMAQQRKPAPPRPTPRHVMRIEHVAAPRDNDTRLDVGSLNDSIRHLMSEYAGLRARAEDIISQIDGGANNYEVVGNGGRQWYSDEREFQTEISNLATALNHNSQYIEIKSNLAETETFLYSAGSDAMASCNARNARRELEVADYFFKAVQKEIGSGSVSSDDASDPPQVDSANSQCPES